MKPTMKTLNQESVRKIAERAVANLENGSDIAILDDQIKEYDFGWVFALQSRKFLKTSNPADLIPGLGPLVIDRRDQKAHFLRPSSTPEKEIEKFQEAWRRIKNTMNR
jgi:exonuclease VII small subunit